MKELRKDDITEKRSILYYYRMESRFFSHIYVIYLNSLLLEMMIKPGNQIFTFLYTL